MAGGESGKPRSRGSIRRIRDRVQVRVSAGEDPTTGERIIIVDSVLIEKPGNERSASIHRPDCSRECVVTAEVPFDLGECGLSKLATPGSKGHLWDAIVAHCDQDTRKV